MTIKELIERLSKLPPDMQVAVSKWSEYVLFDPIDHAKIETMSAPRPDGWIQNYRNDILKETYLILGE